MCSWCYEATCRILVNVYYSKFCFQTGRHINDCKTRYYHAQACILQRLQVLTKWTDNSLINVVFVCAPSQGKSNATASNDFTKIQCRQWQWKELLFICMHLVLFFFFLINSKMEMQLFIHKKFKTFRLKGADALIHSGKKRRPSSYWQRKVQVKIWNLLQSFAENKFIQKKCLAPGFYMTFYVFAIH